MNNRFYYAQLAEIDGSLTVVGLSDLSGEVNAPNLIRLPSMDAAKLGDLYQNGEFVTPKIGGDDAA